ncbi:MAG TPA: DNA helicase II, partial [Alphaproteobacteria bacterium]|nr:DNA helicase II [Alphaproteobacteria bacterium]
MSTSPLLAPLNDAQRAAVSAPPQPMLVLAGAGSGKTRVLVHRIAWLVQHEGVSPYGVIAVTFTNKAAAEMRGRIEQLLGGSVRGMWVGTFHGLAHRLLRAHWQEAGLPQSFQILDSEDQLRVVKRLIKSHNLDDAHWQPQAVRGFINARKDEGLRPSHLDDGGDPTRRQMIQLYADYEKACERAGVIDFAEILLRAHELWRDHPQLLAHYQQRFSHILVDEFQDTNAIQYAWIRLLVGEQGVPFIVGDDDQSIYGWRGAKVENIHSFRKHFPDHQLIRLEQNYRSTGNILSAANALIENNTDRLGKNLWTSAGEGEPIQLYAAFNEQDEARFVIQRIQKWIDDGGVRSEVAILYRSNAQSRLFEERLMNSAIPYRVYGGMRFFDRVEIKDSLAYLRLSANRNDDPSFERVVNTPTRGIGNRTVDMVRERARDRELSMWQAAVELVGGTELTARAGNALIGFLRLV